MRRSQVLFENRRYDEAASQALAILQEDPRSPLGHVLLARIHLAEGDFDTGVAECEEAIALNRRHPDAWLLLGHVYHRKGLQVQAITAYREALDLRPDFTEARLSLGYLCKELRRNAEVVVEMERALKEEPDLLSARLLLAEARLELGDAAGALEDAREAIRLNPELPRAHYAAGSCLMKLERYEEAGRAFDEATAVNPVGIVGLLAAAGHRLDERRLDEALALCKQAEKLQPRFGGTALLLGIILLETDRPLEAVDSLRRAQSRIPGSAVVQYHLGRSFERLGQRLEAETSYKEALRHDPTMGEARSRLAQLYAQSGDGDAALASFIRTLSVMPPVNGQGGKDPGTPASAE
jgi:tetratricopeptide (TPR) repeat protein